MATLPRPSSLPAFDVPLQAAQWLRSRVTGSLQSDSRSIQAGDGFIAWPGAASDGRSHVKSALEQGAGAALVELVGADRFGFASESIATYNGLKAATGPIAAAYFDHPTQQLDVVAITGTNGKTSTAWWFAHALSNLKLVTPIPCGLVGTLGIGKPMQNGTTGAVSFDVVANGLTTPDPVLLQKNFRLFVDAGIKACAIEASSIGLEERRLDGTHLHTAVFTNFTQDHLDYHGSMATYWQAKAVLFQWPGLRAAVVNVDDAKGAELAASIGKPSGLSGPSGSLAALDLWTVSCTGPARLRACDIRYEADGLSFVVLESNNDQEERHPLRTHLIGQYNVANLLGVIGAMRTLGVPLAACIASCHDLQPVPGRMECLGGTGSPLVAVDYAHTPDALHHALLALRPLAAQRGGQLWCVFGCGGNRDPIKRPLMGAMAAQDADRVVVTSDNPRFEKPQAIISQILLGMTGYDTVQVQSDRALAIAQAVAAADAQDVVLVAGKGHEDYQDMAGIKLPFSDRAQVEQALAHWGVSRTTPTPQGVAQ